MLGTGETAGQLLARAKLELWQPRIAKRSALLSHEPCPLEALILMGHYIGVDACLHPQLMWLVDCALSPELPVGWATIQLLDGSEYYGHASCGIAQWEHPQVSFLTGVARALVPLLSSA